MTQHYILSNLFLILVDFLVVSNLRRFILDFLIGARNRKSAKNIHNEQTRRNRVMLSYMEPYLKKYIKQYKRFQRLYACVLYTLLPQYLVLILCIFYLQEKSLYVLGLFVLIKLLIEIIVRSYQDAGLVSIFRKK